jgi:hypothetical protein
VLPRGRVKTAWTLHHYGGREALYVYLKPPRSAEPLRLPCAGLGPSHHRVLRGLIPGDDMPQELLRALAALNRRPFHPAPFTEPSDDLLDILERAGNPLQQFK